MIVGGHIGRWPKHSTNKSSAMTEKTEDWPTKYQGVAKGQNSKCVSNVNLFSTIKQHQQQ